MGPTSIGKTDLSISLCEQFNIEVVSVDSVMIYKELNIGSAKPCSSILKKYPHSMIDIIEPWETYSVAFFYRDLLRNIDDIHKRGKIPLLVGGSMMYFKTFLVGGLSQMNEVSSQIRRKVYQMFEENGLEYLYQFLKKVDKESAKKVHHNDKYRIIRLVEIYFSNNKKKPSKIFNKCLEIVQYYDKLNISIIPNNRSLLHLKIQQRLENMLNEGFLDEVSSIKERYPNKDLPALKTIGYKEANSYLEDRIDIESMKSQILASTRQLAKRQITWLRHLDATTVFTLLDNGNILRRVDSFLHKN
tara:strand:+ start:93 stop:998 length:906 start_codon:yes stop_codon:yes gene_type:complete